MKTMYAFAAATTLAMIGATLGGMAPATAEPSTVRIETRAFYGATVTLEEGVRVFRPLPPHSRVVINPGGTTPLHLSIGDDLKAAHAYAKASATAGAAGSEVSQPAVGGFGGGQRKPHGKPPLGKTLHSKPAPHGPGPGKP